MQNIPFPSVIVKELSAAFFEDNSEPNLGENGIMIVKAIVGFKKPMSCPPFSKDPLNVNCIPPWARPPKHTSEYVVFTSDSSETAESCFYRLPIEKIDTEKYKSVKDENEAVECIAEKTGYELSPLSVSCKVTEYIAHFYMFS